MSHYGPYEGLRVYMMTPKKAEEHTRRAYNVPPDCGLGWTPYTILVHSHGATSYTAFHSVRQLRQWLGGRFTVKLDGRAWNGPAIRAGRVVPL